MLYCTLIPNPFRVFSEGDFGALGLFDVIRWDLIWPRKRIMLGNCRHWQENLNHGPDLNFSKPFIPCILCESLMAVPPPSQASSAQSLHPSEPIPPHLISSQRMTNSSFPTTHNSFFDSGYELSVWCISVSIFLRGCLGRLQKTDRDKAGRPSAQCEVDKMRLC